MCLSVHRVVSGQRGCGVVFGVWCEGVSGAGGVGSVGDGDGLGWPEGKSGRGGGVV